MSNAVNSVLTLTCPRCRTWFPSSIQVDSKTFVQIALTHMLEKCPVPPHRQVRAAGLSLRALHVGS